MLEGLLELFITWFVSCCVASDSGPAEDKNGDGTIT
jgi:hypothetical protein